MVFFQIVNSNNCRAQNQIYSKNYSFKLIENWKLISDTDAQHERERTKSLYGIETPPFDYALQLKQSDYLFQRPFIIVRENKDGKIPLDEIEKLTKLSSKQFDYFKETIYTETNNYVSVNDIKMQFYDDTRNVIYSIFGAYVESVGNTIHIQAWLLTKFGYIQVIGSFLAEDFNHRYTEYLNFVNNFKIKVEY